MSVELYALLPPVIVARIGGVFGLRKAVRDARGPAGCGILGLSSNLLNMVRSRHRAVIGAVQEDSSVASLTRLDEIERYRRPQQLQITRNWLSAE
jgi:hypothetical protein